MNSTFGHLYLLIGRGGQQYFYRSLQTSIRCIWQWDLIKRQVWFGASGSHSGIDSKIGFNIITRSTFLKISFVLGRPINILYNVIHS
jgi:hypothetical protein